MTNKEKALMLVWEHYNAYAPKENRIDINQFLNDDNYYCLCAIWENIEHAKITASKIAEYNKEGEELLNELNKL